jgi:hypothetical protein
MKQVFYKLNSNVWRNISEYNYRSNLNCVPAASVRREQNCTSGSLEMVHCMNRQIFVVSNSCITLREWLVMDTLLKTLTPT